MNRFSSTVIAAGDSRCVLDSALGGSILSWHIGDQRTAGPNRHVLNSASFPLVPFSNRIARGRLGRDDRGPLPPSIIAPPHAIHGIGWQRGWTIVDQSGDSATMICSHIASPDWPWAFDAIQTYTVTPTSLSIEMSIVNRATETAPAAFGHHPYFDATGARLMFRASSLWVNDATGLPTHSVFPAGDADFSAGAAVAGKQIDHCYTGWDGAAAITWDDRPHALIVIGVNLPAAVLYIPQGEGYFCFEPVPHMTDAINRPDCPAPMQMLEPGQAASSLILMQARLRQ